MRCANDSNRIHLTHVLGAPHYTGFSIKDNRRGENILRARMIKYLYVRIIVMHKAQNAKESDKRDARVV